jgi:hypothetical protein
MLSQILQQIQQMQQEAKQQGHSLWYRGHRDAKWFIKSSIHRRVDYSFDSVGFNAPENERIDLLRELSKSLFHRFKARSVHLLAPHERSPWGTVFAMQHLGLPSRLLDWTESFPCALYFAHLRRNSTDDAAVFVLRPDKLNHRSVGLEELVFLDAEINMAQRFNTNVYHPAVLLLNLERSSKESDLETVAVAPAWTNPRMVAQRSAFTLCGTSFQPLEEKYADCITKIVLPSADYKEVDAFLDIAGQSHFGLFPDLEGLREQLIAEMDQEILAVKGLQTRNPA